MPTSIRCSTVQCHHIVCQYTAGEFDAMLGHRAPATKKRKHSKTDSKTGKRSSTALTVKRTKSFPTVAQVQATDTLVNAHLLHVSASTLFQLNCSQATLTGMAIGIAHNVVHAGAPPSSTALHALAGERSVLMDKSMSYKFGSKVRVHSLCFRCFLLPPFLIVYLCAYSFVRLGLLARHTKQNACGFSIQTENEHQHAVVPGEHK
jgi:hypothetical protein